MFEELFGYALAMVKLKYPNEFTEPKFKKEVFDLTDMIIEELYHKNGTLFFRDYASKFSAWNDDPELCKRVNERRNNIDKDRKVYRERVTNVVRVWEVYECQICHITREVETYAEFDNEGRATNLMLPKYKQHKSKSHYGVMNFIGYKYKNDEFPHNIYAEEVL